MDRHHRSQKGPKHVSSRAAAAESSTQEHQSSPPRNNTKLQQQQQQRHRQQLAVQCECWMKILNRSTVRLSYVRRLALLESLQHLVSSSLASQSDSSLHHNSDYHSDNRLTELVVEGILGAPSLSDLDKDLLLRHGLLEQRWDCLWRAFDDAGPAAVQRFHGNDGSHRQDNFWNVRRLALVLLRTSRKVRAALSDDGDDDDDIRYLRLKALIVRTQTVEELTELLRRALERMMGGGGGGGAPATTTEFQARVLDDFASGRYYRLLGPHRLDCEEEDSTGSNNEAATEAAFGDDADRKLPAQQQEPAPVYGSLLLPEDLSQREDCCPICLEPLLERAPALKLSCRHAFCSSCIGGWIQQELAASNNSTTTAARNATWTVARAHSNHHRQEETNAADWHCPVCRQRYE